MHKLPLPAFPRFVKLEVTHKNLVRQYVSQFPPYSDFNFVSMFSYNTNNDVAISNLHDNLVVIFNDYLTNQPFLSFLGINKPIETLQALHHFAQKKSISPTIKLVPEIFIQKHRKQIENSFSIVEDIDSHDYIYNAHDLATLDSPQFASKRRLVNIFRRRYKNHEISTLNLEDASTIHKLQALFVQWSNAKHKDQQETAIEKKSFDRLLYHAHHLDIQCIGISVDSELKAFLIYEISHNYHGIGHFGKTDYEQTGIYQMLIHAAAIEMFHTGCTFINLEQDLGLEGLRISKRSWNPTHYLKKYILQYKNL